MVKIRLQRHGRKGKPFYYIVAADVRAPRDGRFIERIGSYNPNTNPATIDLQLDSAVRWLQNGAEPTDTCRAILSYKGATHLHHLLKGVNKGAHTEDQAYEKFNQWMESKTGLVSAKVGKLAQEKADAEAAAFQRETTIREERGKAILAKNTPEPEVTETEDTDTEATDAEAPAEDAAEAPAAEEVATTEE